MVSSAVDMGAPCPAGTAFPCQPGAVGHEVTSVEIVAAFFPAPNRLGLYWTLFSLIGNVMTDLICQSVELRLAEVAAPVFL